MKILICGNGTGSKFYRYVAGARFLESQGHQIITIQADDPHYDSLMRQSDVVLFQMAFSPSIIREAKRLGKRVIVEADDLLHYAPMEHYAHKELSGWGGIRWWFRVFFCLVQADGFICTNRKLAGLYGWMCRRTLVWPNKCDLQHWIRPVRRNASDEVRVLWAGSKSHTEDLKFLAPIMRRVMELRPQVKFLTAGHGGCASDDPVARFKYGENDIFGDLPRGRREMILPVPAEVWPSKLNGLCADIALAPLVRNAFAEAKSQCKFLEYGINAVPGVYSRWFYTDVRDGLDGILGGTEDEWVEAIVRLVDDKVLRERMGDAARERIIRDFDVRFSTKQWGDFILGRDCGQA